MQHTLISSSNRATAKVALLFIGIIRISLFSINTSISLLKKNIYQLYWIKNLIYISSVKTNFKRFFVETTSSNYFTLMYLKALSMSPPLHPLFPNLVEQSTRFCSLSETKFPVLRKCCPTKWKILIVFETE